MALPTSDEDAEMEREIHCKNLSENLAKSVGLPSRLCGARGFLCRDSKDEKCNGRKWIPPPVHGLQNSDPVIPSYYMTGKELRGNLFHIDFLFTIQDNIRNYRPLTEHQQAYLKTLTGDQLIELVLLYNERHRTSV
jgi:hypothetical protein